MIMSPNHTATSTESNNQMAIVNSLNQPWLVHFRTINRNKRWTNPIAYFQPNDSLSFNWNEKSESFLLLLSFINSIYLVNRFVEIQVVHLMSLYKSNHLFLFSSPFGLFHLFCQLNCVERQIQCLLILFRSF